MFNLLESHDTSRLLSLCGNDKRKARLAYLFMFSQVGSPCIYYGSEVGMNGSRAMGSEDNRKCMIWDEQRQDLEFKSFIKDLILWRKKYSEWNDLKYTGIMSTIRQLSLLAEEKYISSLIIVMNL